MKKFLTLLLAYLFVTSAQATHLQGAEITWQCKSNGKYVFTLSVYRDCGGVILPTTAQTLGNNAGVTISCTAHSNLYGPLVVENQAYGMRMKVPGKATSCDRT
jgi:hypothetical protein